MSEFTDKQSEMGTLADEAGAKAALIAYAQEHIPHPDMRLDADMAARKTAYEAEAAFWLALKTQVQE